MFTGMITLFNYDEENNTYYTTLFENAELQPKYKTQFTSESTESSDLALLILEYKTVYDSKVPFNGKKYYELPKIWQDQSLEDKKLSFTFNPGRDFFVKGNLADYPEPNYEEIKNAYDDVFLINSVKDFEDILPHWEVEGS